MSLGSWEVDVTVGSMPQKVASAFGKLNEMVGAEYTPIAYLGSQVVNGTNHAVLAEQLVITGKDTKNVVLVIFNEKPGDMEDSLVNIERVIEGGAEFGGATVDVQTEIPEDALEVFNLAAGGIVGSKLEPIALLATQVVKGTNYAFLTKVTPVTLDPVSKIAIVTVNALTKDITFTDLLGNKNSNALGYAFTW